jgi:hypothetical protein
MKTNAPKVVTWVIATLLGVLGIIGRLEPGMGFLSENHFYLLAGGFIILVLATVLKGL